MIKLEKSQSQVNNQNTVQPHIDCLGNCTSINVKNLTVTDDRGKNNYYLYIRGIMNNTGPTLYGAFLHVTAYNKEGIAIDKFYPFGGMSGHSTLGLDFRLPYSGSPISNVTLYLYTSTPRISNDTFT